MQEYRSVLYLRSVCMYVGNVTRYKLMHISMMEREVSILFSAIYTYNYEHCCDQMD